MLSAMESARVNQWTWVRVPKTRSATACHGHQEPINGEPSEAASVVRVGARVEMEDHGRSRVLEIARVIDKRVGDPQVAESSITARHRREA